jgi:putative sterol carrier protein
MILAAVSACALGATCFLASAFAADTKDSKDTKDADAKDVADTKDVKDAKEIVLQGGAVWNGNRKTAVLKATLTPADKKNEYSVVYDFTWEGSKQTWKGIMRGNLQNGNVAGTGATPDGKRTFVFQARAVNGVLTGKHYETTGGKNKLTGDIGLKP